MSKDIDREEQELKRKLEELKRKREAEAAHTESLNLCVGKYFRSCKNPHSTTSKVSSYLHVIALAYDGSNWKDYISVDRFDVNIDRSQWVIENGQIVFKNPRVKTAVIARNRAYELGREMYAYDKIQPNSVSKGKDGVVHIRYTSYEQYQECTKEEYETQLAALNAACASFIEAYDKACKNTPQQTTFTVAELSAISDLVAKIDTKQVTLEQLTAAAKKVAKFNYFNDSLELPELVQYKLNGGKGMHLHIVGGNGGTDYEPYTTHYYIQTVDVDWAKVLYPIRLQIKGKVMDLVAELEGLEEVYNPSNWECQYDSSGYDASFEKAYLNKTVLAKVNALIKSRLK